GATCYTQTGATSGTVTFRVVGGTFDSGLQPTVSGTITAGTLNAGALTVLSPGYYTTTAGATPTLLPIQGAQCGTAPTINATYTAQANFTLSGMDVRISRWVDSATVKVFNDPTKFSASGQFFS